MTDRMSNGEELNPWDDIAFLKLSLKSLGYSVPNLEELRIEPSDVIEIYDAEFRQIFRNMAFMEKSSYTLMETLSSDKFKLFKSSKKIEGILNRTIRTVISGKKINARRVIPVHLITEAYSTSKQEFFIQYTYIEPVYSAGSKDIVGVIMVSNWRLHDIKLNPMTVEGRETLGRIFASLGFDS
jgi:hypothetical protein